ncbi:MAG TPA: hypothetical protein VK943_10645, partial [Arenibaculum sp.]|nr:hypothetical protein [Arenibaculum sp.]
MSIAARAARLVLPLALVAGGGIPSGAARQPDPEAVTRGEYVFDAAGCLGCHTARDGERLAGG